MIKHDHIQIQTKNGLVEFDKDYLYFEEFPKPIATVRLLEDLSDDENVAFRLEVTKAMHPFLKNGEAFECSAKRGSSPYPGMWIIKNLTVANIQPALSTEKDHPKMEEHYIKDVCKIAQGASCCRYLIMGGEGFECANLNFYLRSQIDKRADAGEMAAIGKNCKGYNVP